MFVYITGSLHTGKQRMIKNILKPKNIMNSDGKSRALLCYQVTVFRDLFLSKSTLSELSLATS